MGYGDSGLCACMCPLVTVEVEGVTIGLSSKVEIAYLCVCVFTMLYAVQCVHYRWM